MARFDIAVVMIILMVAGLAFAAWRIWWNGLARSDRRDRARDDARWRDKLQALDEEARDRD